MIGRRFRASLAVSALVKCLLPEGAYAASRYSIGEVAEASVVAHAQIDFTIVIPEIILLEKRSETEHGSARKHTSHLANSKTEMNANLGNAKSSFVALGNSDVLAVQPMTRVGTNEFGPDTMASFVRENSTVVFVAAMP